MKKTGICILILMTMLLACACGGGGEKTPAAQENPTAQEATGAPEGTVEQGVSYKHRDYEDKYYHFQLKTPILSREDYKGLSYYIEGKSDDLDDKRVLLIAHFNERQEAEKYNASDMNTAASALEALHMGKVNNFTSGYYGIKLKDIQCETETKTVAGLDAVKFSGYYTFDKKGSDWNLGAVGYCIRGKYTPVLLIAIDMSEAQDHLEELAALIDEMAGTYIDGTGPA